MAPNDDVDDERRILFRAEVRRLRAMSEPPQLRPLVWFWSMPALLLLGLVLWAVIGGR